MRKIRTWFSLEEWMKEWEIGFGRMNEKLELGLPAYYDLVLI